MSFLDKLKAGVQAVTGTAAKLELQSHVGFGFQGDNVWVSVVATSAGTPVAHQGVFIDVEGTETVSVKGAGAGGADLVATKPTFAQTFPIAPAGHIADGATVPYHGGFQLPASFPVSYDGLQANHAVRIRARLEMAGNDPTSAWVPFHVIRRPVG